MSAISIMESYLPSVVIIVTIILYFLVDDYIKLPKKINASKIMNNVLYRIIMAVLSGFIVMNIGLFISTLIEPQMISIYVEILFLSTGTLILLSMLFAKKSGS